MQPLIDGFRRFRESYFEENRELFTALAEGQSPKTLLIGCCDSRVDPALLFSSQPGDLFVLRNVANLVPPFAPDRGLHGTSAAVEFAVRNLEVENIVVLGHARCGGVKALLNDTPGTDDSDFINGWMSIARTARDRALALTLSAGLPPESAARMCEQETVAISMANLMTFPWLRERVQQGRLGVYGLWFDLDKGELFHLDPATNTFRQV